MGKQATKCAHGISRLVCLLFERVSLYIHPHYSLAWERQEWETGYAPVQTLFKMKHPCTFFELFAVCIRLLVSPLYEWVGE